MSKGAFTGADRARAGVFEEAHGGTLFLDEIGDLPLDMQPKLLRAIEAREVRAIGADRARPVDVRIVAATSRKLGEAARAGTFRVDLFYRLAVVRLVVPPLRDRPDDVVPLACALLRQRDPAALLPPDVASMLTTYSWPGNVRELRNVVERWSALGESRGLLGSDDASPAEPSLETLPYHEARQRAIDAFESAYLPRALARAGGVVSQAAKNAQVARASFYRMLQRVQGRVDEGES